MATDNYSLAPPRNSRAYANYGSNTLQGSFSMENVRQTAIDQLAPHLSSAERAVAIEAVDATMYQLMCVLDGVRGGLSNSQYQVDLHMIVQLRRSDAQQTSVLEHMDLRDGDGMCMGIHGWLEGDYGARPIIEA